MQSPRKLLARIATLSAPGRDLFYSSRAARALIADCAGACLVPAGIRTFHPEQQESNGTEDVASAAQSIGILGEETGKLLSLAFHMPPSGLQQGRYGRHL